MRRYVSFFLWVLLSVVGTIGCWLCVGYFEIEFLNLDEEIAGLVIALILVVATGAFFLFRGIRSDHSNKPGLFWFITGCAFCLLMMLLFGENDFEEAQTGLLMGIIVMAISGVFLYTQRNKHCYKSTYFPGYGIERFVIWLGICSGLVFFCWVWFANADIEVLNLDEDKGGLFSGLVFVICITGLLMYRLRYKIHFSEHMAYLGLLLTALNLAVYFFLCPEVLVKEEIGVSSHIDRKPFLFSMILSVLIIAGVIAVQVVKLKKRHAEVAKSL